MTAKCVTDMEMLQHRKFTEKKF